MSIESQRGELDRAFAGRTDIDIVARFEESKSAKAPGRPIFSEMLLRIERGEAEGIIAWAPDRLARNSIDGGRIVYLLDGGVIRDLKFSTYTFENNSQGKFMLSIMFGQSKYYSDALSENVKRGNRTKLGKGWRPNKAPLGYRNDPDKTISPDPVIFPLIRRMFELVLAGAYSAREIASMARDEWGLRTPKRKRSGGTPPALGTIYKILGNRFYAGLIVWNGAVYRGQHEPVVTIDEFERVQHLMKRAGQRRPKKHAFPFTGLIRCGACGLMVTAEQKVNKYGSQYTYYHCTKRGLGPRCGQPAVSGIQLEKQFADFLRSIAIDPRIGEWLLEALDADRSGAEAHEFARQASVEAALSEAKAQISELTSLRLRRLLSDDEFVLERRRLEQEALRLEESRATTGKSAESRLELSRDLISFSIRAVKWFERGDAAVKRLIVQTVGSNFCLRDKIVSIQATKPFLAPPFSPEFLRLCGDGEDVRTFSPNLKAEYQAYIRNLSETLDDPACAKILGQLKTLREWSEGEELKEAA